MGQGGRALDDLEPDDPGAVRYAQRLLATSREELHRADTKVSIVFAATGAAIATFIAGALAGGWSPVELTAAHEVLWWASTATAGAALVLMGAAVYPRGRQGGTSPTVVAYYGDVAWFHEPAALRAIIERSASRELDQLVDQLVQVSRLVRFKYYLLAVAMWALLASAVGCSLAVVLQSTGL
jgi:hypothetical protein